MMEADLEVKAKESREKKEFEKKEGKFDPNSYSRENRWQAYLEEEEKKKEQEEKQKSNTIFKEYNEMMEEHKNRPPPGIYNKDGKVRQLN